MKTPLSYLLVLSLLTSVLAAARPLLDFQIRVEENGELISDVSWRNLSNYPSRVLVAQKYNPNGSLSLNMGSEVDSITKDEGDLIAYTTILRVRELDHSIGDPEEKFIATLNTREFFLSGKAKVGSTTVFNPEPGIQIEFIIRKAESQPKRTFKTRAEFYQYLESQNTENFSIESPEED